ncbi:NAD(P)-dependent alcohol dehydrogenase [Aurantiacibacter luteus]|uniref:Geraniol dehydrogenase n=1 Tax=Aurantiacibacter luteus TaxID=1581420 RepID=A0A0G9MNR4_9SPHN|nr:NAD(P)-dependent alcohol dehydrogenase [Aurantiacibacter luteus]KLE32350.1 geraniol dehydrogenase [Aurantiacibacter luteus]
MTTTARVAICPGEGKEFNMAEVTLDDLREDELLVRVVATDICHTDMAVRDQQLPTPLPAVLGHEGAGIVEAVGSKVSAAGVGDRVIMSFNSCGHCPSCEVDAPTYCYEFGPNNFAGRRPDGSATITRDGEEIGGNFFGQSSFATHAIAHERNVVRVPDSAADLPLERLAPLGCGLMTGAGAVLRSMEVREGLPIAVFGTGTVGLAAVMAAKIAGADPIIAVDMHESRLELAKELGATHTVKAGDDAMDRLKEAAPDGLAYAFDTTGVKKVIESVFEQIAPKGILGLVGASPPEDMLKLNEASLMGGGKRVIGILGGDSDIAGFICELIAYHQDGKFPFDRLIEYFDFDDINAGIEASESGEVVKPVLRISPE